MCIKKIYAMGKTIAGFRNPVQFALLPAAGRLLSIWRGSGAVVTRFGIWLKSVRQGVYKKYTLNIFY